MAHGRLIPTGHDRLFQAVRQRGTAVAPPATAARRPEPDNTRIPSVPAFHSTSYPVPPARIGAYPVRYSHKDHIRVTVWG